MAATIHTDVCVIGAGPGGMLLSLLLSRDGYRVVLVERAPNFERTFRGEFLQPGALPILESLGVLPIALEKGEVIKKYKILENDNAILTYSFEELPGRFQYGLNISQSHILPLLLSKCQENEGFVFKQGFSPTHLVERNGNVHGVVLAGENGEQIEVRSKLVVGADGRNSTIRRLAQVPIHKHEFHMDILWTKLPRPESWGERRHEFIFRIYEYGLLGSVPSYPNMLQLGIDMPKGGYQALKEQGLDKLLARIIRAIPEAEQQITASLVSWSSFQQLVATGALSMQWAKNGLVLIGDAAHTIGPIAGQGLTQALKDALVLRRLLNGHLNGEFVSQQVLDAFQQERFPEIKSLYRLQSAQERLLTTTSLGGRLLRRAVYWSVMNTPVKKSMASRMTMQDVAQLV